MSAIVWPQRRKPQIGDRRTTKKHGLQIRVVETHGGMWVKSGSRYRYDWRKPSELVLTSWAYLLTAADHHEIAMLELASLHLADLEETLLFGAAA